MVPSSPNPSRAMLHVFNRYLLRGGEEMIVEQMHDDLSKVHPMTWCRFASAEWTGQRAAAVVPQVARLFYNRGARHRFEAALDASEAGAALFHNVHPVGSPSLYHAAMQRRLPVIQFLHNFRPFSVGGTLQANGKPMLDALYGNYWEEVRAGAWQNSVVKSALFALMLLMLHKSGWLESVKAWIVMSDYIKKRLIDAGTLPPTRVHVLRHAWHAIPKEPTVEDAGYYLFLARLAAPKGVLPLLDAWDRLRTQLGDRTPFLHIAGEGPLEQKVRERMRHNPYIGHLGHITGETKREALRRCRALMVPSTWWEPLGLVVYEAYDYLKPVVAAHTGGLGETVQHGVTGLLHEPGNVDGIVRNVLEMESMPESKRAELGRAGREWLLREADPQAWLLKFEEIWSGAVSA